MSSLATKQSTSGRRSHHLLNSDNVADYCVGENAAHNFWLIDSGTTSHMTPFLSDILPGTLKRYRGYIKVTDS
jgi:hypothetical protein